MPKARQTCTRCSMRRQKCDKQQPCSRCIAAGEAHQCTRIWHGGYDASVHRQYPKSDTKYRRRSSATTQSASRRSSDDPHGHEHQHDGTLHPPGLDSDSDGYSSEHDRRSSSGGRVGYEAINEDFLWSPDPLCRAMILDNGALTAEPFATSGIDPRLGSYSLADSAQKARSRSKPPLSQQEASYLEDCLPNGLQILQLVDYHEENLLWYTHCYHGPSFRRELTQALHASSGRLAVKDLDLRWCALLFAILSSSLCCASEASIRQWSFPAPQRLAMSRKWHEAAMECLRLAQYTERPHICSIQAILVLVGPSQVLGLSQRQTFMLGAALKIAQALGLQNLPRQSETTKAPTTESAAVSREVGRRVWWSLVAHDWTSIASYDIFSIDSAQFTTSRPQSYDISGLHGPDRLADIHNHILDIATILKEFHVASSACTDPTSEYEQVFQHHQKLRALMQQDQCLEDLTLPWGFWAKSLLKMKLAHKIIDIHRNFYDRSFQDTTYAWSRWASIEAGKEILQEAISAFEDAERPAIWTDQSHIIVAGITLGKDALKRSSEEPEREEHLLLVRKAMTLLERHRDSVLANRGHKVLAAFLEGSRQHTPEERSATDFTMFSYTASPLSSPMTIDPELAGPTFTTAPGDFELPSISVDPVVGEQQNWMGMDMMPAYSQLGFEGEYNGF